MVANVVPDQPSPGSVTVVVSGEVDLGDQDAFRSTIVDSASPPTTMVVLDLTGVTFLGSSGIGALITAWKELGDRHIGLRLEECSDIVGRVLEIAGVRDLLDGPEVDGDRAGEGSTRA